MRKRSFSNVIPFFVIVPVLLVLPLVVKSDYDIHILVMVGIFSLLTMGFNLVFGYIGQLSLGHTAYYAIGAYASALITTKLGVSFWIGLIFAGIVTGIFGFVIGFIALQWRGHFFVIATICFWGIIHLVIINWVSLTNGPVGIVNVPIPTLGGMAFLTKIHFYYFVIVLVFAVLWFTHRIVSSSIGRAFRAVRENETLSESIGVSAFRFATLAFVISTVLAGIAGSLSAHYITYVSPEIADFSSMISILVMVVIGGRGTVAGPLLGALIVTFLQEYLRFAKEFRLPIFGLILILGIVFLPKGIIAVPRMISAYLKGEK